MNFDAEYLALVQHFQAQWTLTPVRYPNVPLNPSLDYTAGYVAFHVLPGAPTPLDITRRGCVRYVGVIAHQLFIPQEQRLGLTYLGSTNGLSLAAEIAAVWKLQDAYTATVNGRVSGRILVQDAEIRSGIDQADGTYMIPVTLAYTRDLY